LTSIIIPDGVVSIEAGAFVLCSSLEDVHIGTGVTTIGMGAFDRCTSLTKIIIPENVKEIDQRAFFGCSALTVAYFIVPGSWYRNNGRDYLNAASLSTPSVAATWLKNTYSST
jgi:hypothetical protein